MDVKILMKNLSTIDESPALAILDPFSQDNLEPFLIGIEEICVAFHPNSVSLASSSMMTVPAVDLPYWAPESDFSTLGAVLRCRIRRGFNIVRDIRPDLRSATSQKKLFFYGGRQWRSCQPFFLKSWTRIDFFKRDSYSSHDFALENIFFSQGLIS